jgi:hypothetical protein
MRLLFADWFYAVRRENLVAEAGDSFGNLEEGERPPLEAATRQRLVKTEETICVTVIFGVCDSVTLL